MSLSDRDPIGGYFGLELPESSGEYYKSAYRYQSARSAFLTLLLATKPDAVWMPWYICESMAAPLVRAGVEIKRYSLDLDFKIVDRIGLSDNELILYVNYFGLCDTYAQELADRFPLQLILDNSQAFYSKPLNCLATIYSPRKFFGVPDGGYLVTDRKLEQSAERDETSFLRTSHLLKRLGGFVEAGRDDFQTAESSLSVMTTDQMSRLTQGILSSISYGAVRAHRRRNFEALHEHLGASNDLAIQWSNDAVPLCYPYLQRASPSLRPHLQSNRVFCPTYWPCIAEEVRSRSDMIHSMCSHMLPLPVDQRYDSGDMARINELISKIPTN